MSPRVDSAAKDITIHLSPDGTTVEGITPNDLALVERQTDLRVIDIEEEVRAITADAAEIHTAISGLVIRDDADMQKMNGLMNRAKDAVTQAEQITNPVRSFLNNLHKKACNIGSGSIKTLKEDAKFADGRMKDYARQQKAAAEEARRIADAAVAKENAERERIAREEIATKQREADRLRELGRISEAKALTSTPVVAPIAMPQVQVIPRAAPRLAGTSAKWPWTAKVVDKMAIIRAIADGTIPLTYTTRGEPEDLVDVNLILLRALGKQRQADLNIPGAESFEEPQFARSRS